MRFARILHGAERPSASASGRICGLGSGSRLRVDGRLLELAEQQLVLDERDVGSAAETRRDLGAAGVASVRARVSVLPGTVAVRRGGPTPDHAQTEMRDKGLKIPVVVQQLVADFDAPGGDHRIDGLSKRSRPACVTFGSFFAAWIAIIDPHAGIDPD